MRVDLQRPMVALQRLARFGKMGIAVPHPGPRAKVARHSIGRVLAIGNALPESLLEVIGNRSLVVSFGKIGVEAFVHGLGGAGQLPVGLAVLSAAKPDRPERVLGHPIDHRVGVAQLPRYRRRTTGFSNQTQRQQSDFSRVDVIAAEQLNDLLGRPVALEEREQPLQILGREQWLDESYELVRID